MKARKTQVWAVFVEDADSVVSYGSESMAEQAAELERQAGRKARVEYLGEATVLSFRVPA